MCGNSSYDASVEDTSNTVDDTEGSSQEVSDPHVSSLLKALHSPTLSQLACKRSIQRNSSGPLTGKKRCKGSTSSEPKSVKPVDRVKQYPGDHFVVSANKLFCSACREEVSTKKRIIDLHIKSAKHQKGKKILRENKILLKL